MDDGCNPDFFACYSTNFTAFPEVFEKAADTDSVSLLKKVEMKRNKKCWISYLRDKMLNFSCGYKRLTRNIKWNRPGHGEVNELFPITYAVCYQIIQAF